MSGLAGVGARSSFCASEHKQVLTPPTCKKLLCSLQSGGGVEFKQDESLNSTHNYQYSSALCASAGRVMHRAAVMAATNKREKRGVRGEL